MKTFRQQVQDIKFWNYWVWAGVAMIFLGDIPIFIVIMLDMCFGITLNIPGPVLLFMMYMFFIGPVITLLLMGLGVFAIKRRNVCSRCGKKLKIRELEQMGDSFLCPYCLNDKFSGN